MRTDPLTDIYEEMTVEYIERHRETMESLEYLASSRNAKKAWRR